MERERERNRNKERKGGKGEEGREIHGANLL